MDEPTLTDRIALLRGGWLFAECTDDEIERIAALAHGMRVPAGHVVVREGDLGCEFYVVADGTARVSVGDGQAVADLTAGSFFGEMALLDGGDRVATVTATTELELLVLHRDVEELGIEALRSELPAAVAAEPLRTIDLREHLELEERNFITEVLARCGGIRSKAAKELGISERNLYQRLQRWRGAEEAPG